MAWVSFCISTYMRPKFLQEQISLLLQQTFTDFEIVISDNDPAATGKEVAASFNDSRIKYYHNNDNLGMIKSFNKSIERAATEFIVMVTDDDPVEATFLAAMHGLQQKYPGYSLYGGFARHGKNEGAIEVIGAGDFVCEILHPGKTINLLWSSCLLEKASVIKIGKIPDYGSPHLADHALLALTGAQKGAVVVNKMFSTLTSHNTNFSKLNLDAYYLACEGFYNAMTDAAPNNKKVEEITKLHLKNWFIVNVFTLKKYYTATKPDKARIEVVEEFVRKVLAIDFMGSVKMRYFFKQRIFKVKLLLGLLK